MTFDSCDVLKALKKLNLIRNRSDWWWPNPLSFETVIGAILTQNVKWENVEKSLDSLRRHGFLRDDESALEAMATIPPTVLASHIAPSGFFNQKSTRLVALSQNVLRDFGSFKEFVAQVDAEWLLAQKGIGKETADCILNYACGREVMAVDKYTYKLLCSLGIQIDDYDELKAWFERGIVENLPEVLAMYGEGMTLARVYARFHGKIVEFQKRKITLEL